MSDQEPGRCDGDAMKLIADYWVLRIVEELNSAGGSMRFTALQRALGGASPATLSNRLQRLEDRGVISRCAGDEAKSSVRYTLTPKGVGVLPVIQAIDHFADQSH